MAGEYTPPVDGRGRQSVPRAVMRRSCSATRRRRRMPSRRPRRPEGQGAGEDVPPRPPGFCIGCPERPIFAAMKLVEQELGPHQVAGRYRLPSVREPAAVQYRRDDDGLRSRPGVVVGVQRRRPTRADLDHGRRRLLAQRPLPGIGNAVFNKQDGVILVVDNYYSAATGGQDILSSRAINPARATNNTIVDAVKGVGAKWVRQIDRTYDVARMRETLREALTTQGSGPKIIVASSECMLNKQRRVKPLFQKAVATGKRMVQASASASTRTSAPAITPASGSPAVRRSRSSTPTIRSRTIRSRRSTITASAAAIAARWRKPRCSARRSIAPTSSTIRPGGTASRPAARRGDRLPAAAPRSARASSSRLSDRL